MYTSKGVHQSDTTRDLDVGFPNHTRARLKDTQISHQQIISFLLLQTLFQQKAKLKTSG